MADAATPQDLLEEVRPLIASREGGKLVALLASLHPADLADLVLALDEDERTALLDHLPTDLVAQLFEFVEDDELRQLIRGVGVQDLPAVLDEVEDDVAADVIQQLEPREQAETLSQLDRADEVAELLKYGDESAGGIMSRGYIAFNEEVTVQGAIDYLRLVRPPSDRAFYVYVVDDSGRLQGTVSIRDLLVSAPPTKLEEITRRDVHAVTTGTDQEEAARILQRYNLVAVPVVDDEGRLEGVTTADDLIDVLQDEATEDMYRMVGLDEEEAPAGSVWRAIRLRLPWLVVNLGTALASTLVLLLFRGTVERAAVLIAFVPAIANQAGVTGTQTATIMVRSLALREQQPTLARQLFRECSVGFVNGLVVGVILGSLAALIEGNITLGIILLCTMTAATTVAAPLGRAIPLLLRAFRVDPALASSIFVTMCTDAISYLLALTLAAALITHIEA